MFFNVLCDLATPHKVDGYRILARCEGGKVGLFIVSSYDWSEKPGQVNIAGVQNAQRPARLSGAFRFKGA